MAKPITHKLQLDDMTVDWVWISLLALWQRWWRLMPQDVLGLVRYHREHAAAAAGSS